MNLEQRVKVHIRDLQRHIKANVLADVGGKVRHATFQQGSLVFMWRCSLLSRAWLTPSNRCSPQKRRNRGSLSRKASLRMVPPLIERRTTSYLSWLAHLSSFHNVSAFVRPQRR